MAARPDPTSSKPPLVGFEADMNKIMNAMLDTSVQRLFVIAIVGPRHVGKTYLAKEIYTSAEVQRHFDVHVWLCVTYYSSANLAIKYVRGQLSIKGKAVISNFLRGKKYCVVIDDLNGDDTTQRKIWSAILRELPDDDNGSIVLVTRRPEYRECSDPIPISKLQHQVGPRSNEESLKMLLQAACPKEPWDGCRAGKVDDLAMKFVRKCEGLPWPLRFLGALLSELPWKEVLGRIEAIEAAGKSFVEFAMSYRDLYFQTDREVFLYFLIFPEDAEIHAKSLVRMLEAQGVDLSYWSRIYLEYLAARSIFEVTKRYSDSSIKCCRLHDPLFRLLAIHEAKEKRFVRADNSFIVDLFDTRIKFSSDLVKKNYKFGDKFMDVAHLADASCIFSFGENLPLETVLMSDRVLEIDDSKVKVDVSREVKKRGELKYLSLNNSSLLPEIIENGLLKMRSLRYLSLRNTKVCEIPKLPASLKTLEVRGTPIETLPEWIASSELESLLLRNTRVSEIPKLPESLKTLDVGGTPIEALPGASFCPNLTTIVLKNTKVREIPEYFTELKYLDVRNTFVRSLPVSLWRKLTSVLATDTFQRLDGPPTSPKENNVIINLVGRPRNYDQLETLDTVHVTKDWAKSTPKFDSRAMKKLGLSYFQNDFTADSALDWNIITRILGGLGNLFSLKIQGSNVPAEIINEQTCPSYKKNLKSLSVGGSYSLFSLRGIKLPPHLITLRLDNLEFDEDPMSILGELETLESLQLRWLRYNVQGKRMICSNGKFRELKRLHFSDISGLEELSVQEGALPRITNVVIESCRDLKNLSDSLVHRKKPPQELHLKVMPTGFTNLFSGLPFVKITKNQV
ncbi:hypothetical protein LUZ63_000626 [Rhynchospora breviuscula]|uniref:NB-ARC domain-containing protein n=1 Tax=Rhynchospora breviuscula TaxID=2022672 RepID=A0A9Q0CVD2_9POAL|nr:hypothetical protein LUZ63_000626 [Rhynchospora breviuscula]